MKTLYFGWFYLPNITMGGVWLGRPKAPERFKNRRTMQFLQELSWISSQWQHFEKMRAKSKFSALAIRAIFRKKHLTLNGIVTRKQDPQWCKNLAFGEHSAVLNAHVSNRTSSFIQNILCRPLASSKDFNLIFQAFPSLLLLRGDWYHAWRTKNLAFLASDNSFGCR